MLRRESSFLQVALGAALLANGDWSLATAEDSPLPPPLTTAVAPTDEAALPAPIMSGMTYAPVPAASPFAGDIGERQFLLGSPGGPRENLLSHGVVFDISSTQYYQGVAAGGVRQEFAYGGRNDYYLNVDGQKAGLWQGLFVTFHGETRYGDTLNAATGAIMPPNAGLLFPQPNGEPTALTGVKVTQALSENFVTFAGKINTLDELKQPFASGRGVDAFMNMALAFPVICARTVPYSTLGAGFAVLHEMQPIVSVMVLDTNNTPMTSGFESFFNNGMTIVAKLDVPVTLADRPGHQGIWGTYSSGTYNDLQPTAYFDPNVGPVVLFGEDTGSWSLSYSADQAFFVDPTNAKRSWGLFTNLGLADDGPSPIRWSANVGLGGSSPWATRPLDTFGIGYAYTAYSDPVQTVAPLLLPIRNDQVVELFYNYALTPWCHITPDLQVLVPTRERTLPPQVQPIDTALVVGVRMKVNF